jgi:hypothetical protein
MSTFKAHSKATSRAPTKTGSTGKPTKTEGCADLSKHPLFKSRKNPDGTINRDRDTIAGVLGAGHRGSYLVKQFCARYRPIHVDPVFAFRQQPFTDPSFRTHNPGVLDECSHIFVTADYNTTYEEVSDELLKWDIKASWMMALDFAEEDKARSPTITVVEPLLREQIKIYLEAARSNDILAGFAPIVRSDSIRVSPKHTDLCTDVRMPPERHQQRRYAAPCSRRAR